MKRFLQDMKGTKERFMLKINPFLFSQQRCESSATSYTKNANGWNQSTPRSMHDIVPLHHEKMELGVHYYPASSSPLYGNAITAEDPEFERNRGEFVGVSTPAQVQFLVSLNVLYILSVKQTGIYFVLTFLYTPYKTE